MNVVRRIAITIAGVVAVALATELVAPKAMHAAQGVLATITNTSANPVPVSGNVNAVVTGNINATLTGTPTVTLNDNVPVSTRSADNPARQAFQAHIQMQPVIGGGTVQEGVVDVPTTTGDGASVKELVIEEVSGDCAGGPAVVDVLTGVNGAEGRFFFAVTGSGVLPAQSVRLYADAGTGVLAGTTDSGVTNCVVWLSGHLVTR
ncbi:MAG TPA: hypothetical protein VFI60_02915 [Candidatus Acidoferrum sp.]|jgi:hypothetical protein|nr:hypothetical protein [Candidatus Acidoferrum sp.]